MMRWIAFIFCLPMTVLAEPVTIRSGEHDTFSRLVISIGEGTEWKVQETETGYDLELTGRSDGFDLSTVFDRIPRERIRALSQPSSNSLSLDVDCACFADAFLWRPGQLVLDIADGEDPNAPINAMPETAVKPSATSSFSLTLSNIFNVPVESDLPFGPLAARAFQTENVVTPGIKETETALLEGLARAASQGFLNAAVTTPQDPSERELLPEIISEAIDPIPVSQQPGVGISTAADRDLAFIRNVIDANFGQQCLDADLFQINDWGDERSFHEQAAGLAEALAGEFGEEPLAAQDSLARLYLHFGFGVEARAVISADNAQSQARRVLAQLAGLIDGYEGQYDLIDAQAGCDTPAALWAFFSTPALLDEDARNHVLQEFFALPQPLRGQIAPRLVRRFVEIGDTDAATKLLRASENNDAETTHEVQAARALLAEERDDPAQAIAVLSQQAGDNARTTPESLIRLIELGSENGTMPQEQDLILVAAMRQEYRDTPIADQLAVAEAIGRAQLGDYQDVFDILRDRDDPSAQVVVDSTFALMTQTATPAVFLEFGYSNLPDSLTPETMNGMARRMIDLGFPERAKDFLAGNAEREAAAERRYLRAEADIETRDYAAVIDELLGMTDNRARDLRAAAYEGLGEHRAALSALGRQNGEDRNANLQFRAGAWERLTIEDDEVLSSFAETVLTPTVTSGVVTLADRRSILTQSQESRRAVEGLLLRFDGVTPEE